MTRDEIIRAIEERAVGEDKLAEAEADRREVIEMVRQFREELREAGDEKH